MRYGVAAVAVLTLVSSIGLDAHDPNATITWNREISRIVFERCASCHRPGGTSFSLLIYQDAQPRAAAIKESVLSRRMPPWGAVQGFGSFRNDQGLMQEQISLITSWVESGTARGNNPNVLPPQPVFEQSAPFATPQNAIAVSGDFTARRNLVLDGLLPDRVPSGASAQIVAVLPNRVVEPLLWLYEYRNSYRHPFLFRKAVTIPAGTVIRGIPPNARILLITQQ
jgi:mono/diheme cytochrome c family protein